MTSSKLLCCAALLMTVTAVPAVAQGLRPFCVNRPSLGAAPCIVDVGHATLEMGVADWERTDDADGRSDTVRGSDGLLRYGVAARTEVQIGWTALGHERTRDPDGRVERRMRTGDVRVAVQHNLRNPDGSGFSIAVQPFATLPVGGTPIGAGTWGAGVVLPVSYALDNVFQLQFTGEVDAAPDEDGAGRHLAYSGIAGLAVTVSEAVSTTVEILVERDRDPVDPATILSAALSAGYQWSDDFQIDAGAVAGLNAASPDVRLFFGFSRRF